MKIYPKIGDMDSDLESMCGFVKDGLELQLFEEDADIESLVTSCIKACPSLKEITLHTVIKYAFIESYLGNARGMQYCFGLLERCKEISRVHDIRVNVLFHCRTRFELLERSSVVYRLGRLLDSLDKTNVHILIENDVCRVDNYTNLCYAYDLVSKLKHSHLFMCLDLCHLQCIANIMHASRTDVIKYFENKKLTDIVHQVHFSCALDGDGYINHKTHGREHSADSLVADLQWLDFLGLSDTILVSEICEEDYATKPNSRFEMELLTAYFSSSKSDNKMI